MDTGIIAGLITAAATIICQLIINSANREKQRGEEKVHDKGVDDRLTNIERRLDEHNDYAKKITTVVTDVELIKNELKHMNEKLKGVA